MPLPGGHPVAVCLQVRLQFLPYLLLLYLQESAADKLSFGASPLCVHVCSGSNRRMHTNVRQ